MFKAIISAKTTKIFLLIGIFVCCVNFFAMNMYDDDDDTYVLTIGETITVGGNMYRILSLIANKDNSNLYTALHVETNVSFSLLSFKIC